MYERLGCYKLGYGLFIERITIASGHCLSWICPGCYLKLICAKGNRLGLKFRHLIPQLSVSSVLKHAASGFSFHFSLVSEQGAEWSYNLVSQKLKANPCRCIALRL